MSRKLMRSPLTENDVQVEREYLTINECAELLGVSRYTIVNDLKKGRLKQTIVGDGAKRIWVEDFNQTYGRSDTPVFSKKGNMIYAISDDCIEMIARKVTDNIVSYLLSAFDTSIDHVKDLHLRSQIQGEAKDIGIDNVPQALMKKDILTQIRELADDD